ncbi:amidase domain-containing protein [Bacillaceae bacterium]
MEKDWLQTIRRYTDLHNRLCLEEGEDALRGCFSCQDVAGQEVERIRRLKEMYKERRARPLKHVMQIENLHILQEDRQQVEAHLHVYFRYVYEQKNSLYEQEGNDWYRLRLTNTGSEWLIEKKEGLNMETIRLGRETAITPGFDDRQTAAANRGSRAYNRVQAVRYAEAYWNSYNPNFRVFDVDCTNYVSQCLYAGGIPMDFTGRRDKGWWYRGKGGIDDSWSYSWAVAHSLRWYLAAGGPGIAVQEMESADQLSFGDIICYDFDGNGHWQHNAIVVAKDGNGKPLVNAHTSNSRRRYWDYRDSYAWTPQIQYKFFHILGGGT